MGSIKNQSVGFVTTSLAKVEQLKNTNLLVPGTLYFVKDLGKETIYLATGSGEWSQYSEKKIVEEKRTENVTSYYFSSRGTYLVRAYSNAATGMSTNQATFEGRVIIETDIVNKTPISVTITGMMFLVSIESASSSSDDYSYYDINYQFNVVAFKSNGTMETKSGYFVENRDVGKIYNLSTYLKVTNPSNKLVIEKL